MTVIMFGFRQQTSDSCLETSHSTNELVVTKRHFLKSQFVVLFKCVTVSRARHLKGNFNDVC